MLFRSVREASEEMIRPSTALGRLPEDAVNRIPRALIERVLAVEAEEMRAA